ncbi:MAG TPA: choice-of-anchor R domain-containing protein [Terriglobales bacterium]|nr:choice-of-anchor R domain-containing protein [Terriglobales bacterium]
MKGLLKGAVLCLAIQMVVSLNAIAAEQNGPILSEDGSITIIPRNSSQQAVAKAPSEAGLVKIYDNIGSAYPKGTYWCCEGATISGPNSVGGVQWWDGTSFTPSADHTVTQIRVAIGYLGGTNEVILTLTNDANGLPGTPIRTWVAKSLPNAGTCCAVIVKTDTAGIPVTKGTRYWITATTNANNADAWLAWNVSDTDQIDSHLSAALCKGSVCRNSGKWEAVQQSPALAAAVLGQ